jgi:hypothetical protein
MGSKKVSWFYGMAMLHAIGCSITGIETAIAHSQMP